MHSDDIAKTQDCMSCTRAKHTKNGYDRSLITKEKLVEIRADNRGPMKTTYCGGNRYPLALTTSERKYVRVHFLRSRSGKRQFRRLYKLD